MKYIDADKMFYGMGCTSTGDTINGVQNFDTAVHVYQNWNMYYYDTYRTLSYEIMGFGL